MQLPYLDLSLQHNRKLQISIGRVYSSKKIAMAHLGKRLQRNGLSTPKLEVKFLLVLPENEVLIRPQESSRILHRKEFKTSHTV
uniref:Testis cDNA clone: QtsA-13216, similar to human paraneoplastic antigen MA2 (PNMA2) n=1 Tax=Macaca fascicularis TaxID=9541 RepID=Q4R876_MACFA|nr:unnamed protein product [Macaca fascicularis]